MTHDDFLRAIVAEPDEDAHRLVYADWLEEHDDPRGEFIRAQVRLAGPLAQDDRIETAWRARQLLDRHEEEWLAPLDELLDEWTFVRGFVEKGTIRAPVLRSRGRDLFRVAPLSHLRVAGAAGDVSCLDVIPADARLTSLDLTANDLTDESIRRLATVPCVARLTHLNLAFNDLGEGAAELLREDAAFDRVGWLCCVGNRFQPQTWEALMGAFEQDYPWDPEREEDALYAFAPGGDWHAGFVSGHRQFLQLQSSTVIVGLFFDHDGQLLTLERRKIDDGEDSTYFEAQKAWETAAAAWRNELRFRPATLRLRRFAVEGGGISDYPGTSAEDPMPQERQRARNFIRDEWLPEGRFVFRWGDDYWVNRQGEIVQT
jgi:uncharacterized protein (TIGR02996 family)